MSSVLSNASVEATGRPRRRRPPNFMGGALLFILTVGLAGLWVTGRALGQDAERSWQDWFQKLEQQNREILEKLNALESQISVIRVRVSSS